MLAGAQCIASCHLHSILVALVVLCMICTIWRLSLPPRSNHSENVLMLVLVLCAIVSCSASLGAHKVRHRAIRRRQQALAGPVVAIRVALLRVLSLSRPFLGHRPSRNSWAHGLGVSQSLPCHHHGRPSLILIRLSARHTYSFIAAALLRSSVRQSIASPRPSRPLLKSRSSAPVIPTPICQHFARSHPQPLSL